MRSLIVSCLLFASLLLGIHAPFLAQETWITQISPLPGVNNDQFMIYRLTQWGDGWLVSVLNESPSAQSFASFGRLDTHGNLQWLLADADLRSYSPSFLVLANGDLLYFQGDAAGKLCPGVTSANAYEVTPGGQILSVELLDCGYPYGPSFLRKNGDILVVNGPIDFAPDLSFKWGLEIFAEIATKETLCWVQSTIENEDETLMVVGHYQVPAADGTWYLRSFVAKLDSAGALMWYKTFDPDNGQYFGSINGIIPAADNGYWLFCTMGPDLLAWPVLVKLNESGDITSQTVYHIGGEGTSGGFDKILPIGEGNLLAVGNAGSWWESGYIMKMGPDGVPEWINQIDMSTLPAPYETVYFGRVFPTADGFLIPSAQDATGLTPPWVFRLDQNGRLGGACSSYFLQPSITTEDVHILTQCNDTLTMDRLQPSNWVEGTSESMNPKDSVSTSTVCGDVFPGVMSAKTGGNPFRLTLTGSNFVNGSTAFVNGAQVHKSKYKGADDLGRTTLVASGSGLKAMLPKGQAVTLTVRNPDGHESDGFQFTR